MLIECARITAVDNLHITVKSARTQACARCEAGRGCGGGLIGKLIAAPDATLRLAVTADQTWREGDTVQLALPARTIMISAALVYLIPLAGLLLGASTGNYFVPTNTGALSGALLGLAGAWAAVRHFAAPVRQHWLQPEITALHRIHGDES